MSSDVSNPKLIASQEALGRRPNATLEVVRIKLTDYARAALGAQVHSIPAASGAKQAQFEAHRERAEAIG